ncbi:Phosphate regulon transcriptional regulatory protein PhoB (SphR) [hydrothermal vent metagenome]|uniref:Phosphate regulon transcriptional regulatory protein PhoB (SphR) n=1 Tax=hydrothermal vent metagenome TaxID=652676 RepID=A0A3B1CWR6_9ZZZZ
MLKQKQRILIVDDEEDLCEILQFNLKGEGFDTEVAYSAEDALKNKLASFDLIILDVMMGKMSGFRLAEKVRKDMSLSIPIVFVTAKNTENDLLTGFSVGGDDYITKPFSINEIIARVKAILKRTQRQSEVSVPSISIGDMELNFDKRILLMEDKEVQLTKKEFEILSLLAKNQGRIFTRTEIFNSVWDDATIVTDRTIDVHITHLRKKLAHYGKYIKSKTGYGYTFEKDVL